MTHKTGRGALVALIAAASIALGAGASSGAPVTISANLFQKWSPSSPPAVPKGTKVVWKNPVNLSTEHDIRAYGGNWTLRKVLDPGDTASKRFTKPGTYRFRCKIHSNKVGGQWTGMVGKIKVTK